MRRKFLSILFIFLTGIIYAASDEECKFCEGNGEVMCPVCDGVGYADVCTTCGGGGRVEKECEACKGTGRSEGHQCLVCRGFAERMIKCPECYGIGGPPCKKCKGAGWITCPKCKGKGKQRGK